jgi:NitT/TauT family transport system substrate-binding protein
VKRVLILAALLAAVIAGCGGDDESSSAGDGPTKVKIGVLPISNVAPLYLGIEKGFFREENLEIEPTIAQSGNEIATALVSNDLQFAFLGWVPAASAASKGLPIKAVANADNGAMTEEKEWTQILVKKGSAIREPADLEGKTIAVNALKGVGETVIKAALEKRGVAPDSFELLEVPFPEMPAALKADRVDAIWAPEPFLTSVLGSDGRSVEAPLTTLGQRYVNGAYATNEQFLGEDEDAVERFVRAINKSLDYATEHPEEARATIPTFTQIPKEVADKIRLPLWPTDIDRDQLDELLGYAVDYGVMEEAPAVDELIWEGAS